MSPDTDEKTAPLYVFMVMEVVGGVGRDAGVVDLRCCCNLEDFRGIILFLLSAMTIPVFHSDELVLHTTRSSYLDCFRNIEIGIPIFLSSSHANEYNISIQYY